LGDPLLAAIQPKIIIIADSELPATRRAKRELKNRLATQNVPVIYTRDVDAIKMTVDKTGCKLQSMAGPTLEFPNR
jgi:hypothetical protein